MFEWPGQVKGDEMKPAQRESKRSPDNLPTSIDVARRAGVSQSAVSLVFGGKASGRIGRETQEAILRAAQELGYRPHRAGQTLRSGRTGIVALVVPDVGNPIFAAVLQGVERVARKAGYSVVLVTITNEQDWQQVISDALASHAVDGFLLFTLRPPADELRAVLQGKAVIVDDYSIELPSLQLDIEGGARAAMSHLLQLGHTRIAHLAAANESETFRLRRATYLHMLEAAGLPISTAYQVQADFTFGSAQMAAQRLLELHDPPSAIFCDSDFLAVGVYKAAARLHRSIPRDLSVVGFDDSLLAHVLEPALTTVAIPTTLLGECAIALLVACLEQKPMRSTKAIPLAFIPRGSTTTV